MTKPNPAHSLGAIQRDIAKHLSDVPMSFDDAARYVSGGDVAYAAMALIRLADRWVARETIPGSYLYVRGPVWFEAATHYKWIQVDIE
jgi:hypothetical protein